MESATVPIHDSSIIQEAKALIEKLNNLTQAASTHAQHAASDHDDNAIDSSGYSMLTPPSASVSERNVEDLPSIQQVHVQDLHTIKPVVSDLDFALDLLESIRHDKGNMATMQSHENIMEALKTGSGSASKKVKLVDTATSPEQTIDLDKGPNIAQFVGDHIALSLDLQTKEACVLSVEGHGPLEVSLLPRPKPDLDCDLPARGDQEQFAKIHRTEKMSKQEDAVREGVPTKCVCKSSDCPAFVESISDPAMPEHKASLGAHRRRLANARALRAPVNSERCACSGTLLDTHTKEAIEDMRLMSLRSPTLSRITKPELSRIHLELAAHELFIGSDGSLKIRPKPKYVLLSSVEIGAFFLMATHFVVFIWMVCCLR